MFQGLTGGSDVIAAAQVAREKAQALTSQAGVLKKQDLDVLFKAVRLTLPWLDTGQVLVELNVKDGQLMSSYFTIRAKTGGD